MKHGCMVMTLSLTRVVAANVAKFTAGKKKARQVRSNVESILIFFFSTSKALSTRNSYPLVKPSMASVTVRFWSGWGRAFGANVQTRGRKTIGFSTMTTRPLTHHSLFDNSWLRKTLQWFPTPIRLTSPPATFSYQDEITAERASFWRDWGDPRRNARGYRNTHIWEIPGMHEIMGNTLGSLYTCPRGLLRRRQWKLGVTVRNFFLWSNSPNFWVAPRTRKNYTSSDQQCACFGWRLVTSSWSIIRQQCTVGLGYDVMKGTECFVSLKTTVVITEQYKVIVKREELTGITEYLTLQRGVL